MGAIGRHTKVSELRRARSAATAELCRTTGVDADTRLVVSVQHSLRVEGFDASETDVRDARDRVLAIVARPT
jgi:hypothetical protein